MELEERIILLKYHLKYAIDILYDTAYEDLYSENKHAEKLVEAMKAHIKRTEGDQEPVIGESVWREMIDFAQYWIEFRNKYGEEEEREESKDCPFHGVCPLNYKKEV